MTSLSYYVPAILINLETIKRQLTLIAPLSASLTGCGHCKNLHTVLMDKPPAKEMVPHNTEAVLLLQDITVLHLHVDPESNYLYYDTEDHLNMLSRSHFF